MYQRLRDELVDDALLGDQPESSKQWVKEMLDYNVPLGKLNRGMAVLDVVRSMNPGTEITDQQADEARILGWCIEFVSDLFTFLHVDMVITLCFPWFISFNSLIL